jgi:N-acetylmuramoyl-L-alanine amidase
VKQAGFWVLWRTAMPSVLVEVGFLTNKKEEKFLSQEPGQDQIAAGIYKAFKEYKSQIESVN